jgi:hypothetical protein
MVYAAGKYRTMDFVKLGLPYHVSRVCVCTGHTHTHVCVCVYLCVCVCVCVWGGGCSSLCASKATCVCVGRLQRPPCLCIAAVQFCFD